MGGALNQADRSAPHYPKKKRAALPQEWEARLADEAVEDAICDSQALRNYHGT